MPETTLIECTSKEQRNQIAELLTGMYPERDLGLLRDQIEAMHKEGYGWVAAYENDTPIAAINFYIGTRLYGGKMIRMDSMWIDPAHREKGIGRQLIEWFVERGKKENCKRIILDSYVENFTGHTFFHRNGFRIRGYHFNRMLEND